jgi:6-phosphofructokinase 1
MLYTSAVTQIDEQRLPPLSGHDLTVKTLGPCRRASPLTTSRLLQQRITDDFAAHGHELNLKLLDPSYVVRVVPANPYDSVYCVRLAHAAVHAAMAGRTEVVVGRWHGRFVHIPIPVAISRRSTVDPDGDLWLSVLESTGQPARFV